MPDQTTDELEQHLVDALEFMINANERYDEGRLAYAKQLAVQIRVLVHHTKTSHALLEQLDYRTRWGWVDEAPAVDPRNIATTSGPISSRLTFLEDDGIEVTYQPYLGVHPPHGGGKAQRFEHWWNRTIVKDLYGNTFSRSEIILAVANKDGGAHVDPKIPARLDALKNGASLGTTAVRREDGSVEFGQYVNLVETSTPVPPFDSEIGIELVRVSPIPAIVRQVSYELIETVRRRAPHFYDRATSHIPKD